jgi:hypothetical protein
MPVQALRLPGGWGSQIHDNRHMKAISLSALRTRRLYPKEIFMAFISVRGWADPRASVQQEWLCQWNIPMTPPWIEPATFRLAAQGPSQSLGRQNSYMKHVQYWRSTNIRCHRTKFRRHVNVASRIFISLAWSDQSTEKELSAARSTHVMNEKCKIVVENTWTEKTDLEKAEFDCRIIAEWILSKDVVRVWIEFIRLTIGISERFNKTPSPTKRRKISLLAQKVRIRSFMNSLAPWN